MANPIWKDKFITLGTGDSANYRVLVGSTVIYTGKAYKRPGASNITVRINDICADYFANVLPTLTQTQFNALTLPLSFIVQVSNGSSWTTKETVEFLNDWSYDYDYNVSTMGMSFPINGRVSANQWLIHTVYNAESVTAVLTFKNGSTQSVVIPISRSNDFNDDFNIDFSRSTASAGSGSVVYDLSQWSNLVSVTIGNIVYRVVDNCKRYVLHYVNAYGGWNSLLIEGNDKESATITRHTKEMEYDNRSTANRGVKNYVNEISKTMTFNTGWMTDAESLLMSHLIYSTEVYVEDTVTGRFYPVTLSTTSHEVKTFRNQGCTMFNYEITVDFSTNMIRR